MNLFYRSIIKVARHKMKPSDETITKIPSSILEVVDLAYRNDGDDAHLLDIYYPKEAVGLLPTIIDIHGGAWIYGNKEVNKKFALTLANEGFGVVNVNYTLMPNATLKQQVQEIFDILHFIYVHGSSYHLDCNQIILAGDSAGGHLAGLVYAIIHQEPLQKLYQVSVPPVTIRGLCLIHGVSDLSFLEKSKNIIYRRAGIMIQGNMENPLAWYRHACLLDVLDGCPSVNTLLISSEKDMLHFQSLQTSAALKEAGWPVEILFWHLQKELNHVFVVLHPEYDESLQTIQKITDFIVRCLVN